MRYYLASVLPVCLLLIDGDINRDIFAILQERNKEKKLPGRKDDAKTKKKLTSIDGQVEVLKIIWRFNWKYLLLASKSIGIGMTAINCCQLFDITLTISYA